MKFKFWEHLNTSSTDMLKRTMSESKGIPMEHSSFSYSSSTGSFISLMLNVVALRNDVVLHPNYSLWGFMCCMIALITLPPCLNSLSRPVVPNLGPPDFYDMPPWPKWISLGSTCRNAWDNCMPCFLTQLVLSPVNCVHWKSFMWRTAEHLNWPCSLLQFVYFDRR